MPGKARTRDANAYEANLLDEINLRLLRELQADGRLGMAELGRRIGMSAPAVAERVQRLERAGVITGYRAEIDPRRSASRWRPSSASGRRPASSSASVRSRPRRREVGECHRITGEDCYLMRLHLRSIDDLEEVLDRFTPHGQTTTSIVHSTPVPRRGPPLAPAEQTFTQSW